MPAPAFFFWLLAICPRYMRLTSFWISWIFCRLEPPGGQWLGNHLVKGLGLTEELLLEFEEMV